MTCVSVKALVYIDVTVRTCVSPRAHATKRARRVDARKATAQRRVDAVFDIDVTQFASISLSARARESVVLLRCALSVVQTRLPCARGHFLFTVPAGVAASARALVAVRRVSAHSSVQTHAIVTLVLAVWWRFTRQHEPSHCD